MTQEGLVVASPTKDIVGVIREVSLNDMMFFNFNNILLKDL
jgi:hypothetical protein